MRVRMFVFAALLLAPAVAQAQLTPEIRPFVGALVPIGDQRDVLKDAVMTGGQLAIEMADRYHAVGTFAFAGPDFRGGPIKAGHMHVYQADLGGEMFAIQRLNETWELRPFLGAGGGVRTYDPTGSGSRSYPAGYGAVGTEFETGNIALRLEARDYFTRFRGVTGNQGTSVRSELAFTAGLAYHIW